MRKFKIVLFGLVTAAGFPAFATTLFTPPALAPGSQYRIVFVTSTTGTGTSTDITTYNTAVNNAANGGGSELQFLGATWTAIASTATVNAIDNIGGASTVPIYLLDGTLVASGTADLFDGTIGADINLTELGATLGDVDVWTGSNADGTADSFGHFLGNQFSDSIHGSAGNANAAWIHFVDSNATFSDPYFGISSVLTVQASSTPEPGTLALGLMGALLLAGSRAVRQNRVS